MPSASLHPSRRFVSPASRCARLVLLAALLLPCTFATAQDTGGSIQGLVTTADGKPIVGAEVVAQGAALQAPRVTTTNAAGQYLLLALPLGQYTVQVRHAQFQPATFQAVFVQLGRTTALPTATLVPLGEVVEQVEVVGNRPLIDPVSTAGGGALSESFFDGLPLDRSYQSIAILLPGVDTSYLGDGLNIDGATGLENRYFIDGNDVTDPYRGAGGMNLPHDLIQAVEVKTGGYEAEYRSALGGLINVVTPSGGNSLSGNIFGYWAGHQFSGDARTGVTDLETTNVTQYDVGFSLGGPIVSDKLRYFIAYNPLVDAADVEIPGLGFYPDETTAQRFAGNLTWQVDPANSVVLTLIGDPTERDGVGETFFSFPTPAYFENPDPYLRDIAYGGLSASLRGTHVLGPHTLLETSLAWLSHLEQNLPATDRGRRETLFVDAPTGAWSGGSPVHMDNRVSQWTLGAKVTWLLDRHALKAGMEYRDIELDSDLSLRMTTRFSDTSYTSGVNQQGGTLSNRIPSLFIQDSWQVSPRLNLNLGLRWDGLWALGSDGQVAQRIMDQYQPRLGVVYEWGDFGSQRLFASAARFYQELLTPASAYYFNEKLRYQICSYDHDPRIDPSGGDCIVIPAEIQPEVKGLRGNYYDEYALGYERRIGQQHRGRVRVLYRTLQAAIEDSWVTASGQFALGNPGRGVLAADYPEASRSFKSLELAFERRSGRFGYLASYVWSENIGNYPGIFASDTEDPLPLNGNFDVPDQVSTGPLPNDRPHVFKASGYYRFDRGLNLGASLIWESGTPLNEFGTAALGSPWYCFLQPRGTAGRTPSIFDLNLRLDYTFGVRAATRWKPRLIVDVYHLFSDERPVDYDQTHYLNIDGEGNQINPNPTYGEPTRYYPPTTVRLGLELSF
jgi:hypothetical protein